jgi:hypothetical protein
LKKFHWRLKKRRWRLCFQKSPKMTNCRTCKCGAWDLSLGLGFGIWPSQNLEGFKSCKNFKFCQNLKKIFQKFFVERRKFCRKWFWFVKKSNF